jgi:hypothetical protein
MTRISGQKYAQKASPYKKPMAIKMMINPPINKPKPLPRR